jgi:uroporphyrinogen-III synthase
MTGEAVRRLLIASERVGLRDEMTAALSRTRTLTRGPKPGQALKEIGITPTRVASVPTTEGIIEVLRRESLSGVNVGVTLAGVPNVRLVDFLTGAGVQAHPVLSYIYAPAADSDRVVDLIERLASGSVDVLLFTSSPQIDRLFDVAVTQGIETKLREGLGRTKLAAIGPVVAETLASRGTPAHIVPGQGFVMKNLVQHVKRALE